MSRRLPLGRVLATLMLSLSLVSGVWALPKEIELDRLMLGVETAISEQQWDKANARLIAAQALDDEMPAVFYFYRGQVSSQLGEYAEAKQALERYLEREGKDGSHYRASLMLLNQLEEKEQKQAQEQIRSASATQLVLQDAAHTDYIEQLKTLYLVESPQEALELHINTLLSNHRYIPGRYRSDRKWMGSLYQIQTHRGEIAVLEKRANPKGGYSLNQSQVSIYGVNPYVGVSCDSVGDQCWIKHPETGKQWLELEANSKAAESIAEAFSHLLRQMQGG
ncbi:tetratricopeptide repeat protein [Litoribrevibacter albus]|nr:tetratricopeptide repeat protein [Litoribrevibacter albus]